MVRRNLLIFLMWIPATVLTITASIMLFLSSYKIKTDENPLAYASPEVLGVNEYQLYAAVPESVGTIHDVIKTGDARPEILNKFFLKHNSPLADHGKFLVELADTYNLDFRLLPAIAMQESNLCKKIPSNSFNCWGFGIYGDKVTRFESFDKAAETVAKSLRASYVDKGLLSAEEIQSRYTPQSNGSWARAVNHFMSEMR